MLGLILFHQLFDHLDLLLTLKVGLLVLFCPAFLHLYFILKLRDLLKELFYVLCVDVFFDLVLGWVGSKEVDGY
jgi:hypothetical protein